MAKYNLYKIDKSRATHLIEKLQSVGLSLAGEKTIDDFNLSLYLSKEPEDIDIWWVDVYKDFLGTTTEPKNKAYCAVFLISNASVLYAISLGKSHFYLKDYCDTDFGINLAERIADNANLKLKNSKLFGGKKSKTIISYQDNSEFEYDSGESIHYVKAKTNDREKWGEAASFGNSVQLQLEITPDELPELVKIVEEELKKDSLIILPRATAISNEEKIAELDQKLAQEIMSTTASNVVQPAEATISGVDFIFLDKNRYRIFSGRSKLDVDGELTLEALRNFIQQNGINLSESINEVKIKVSDDDGKGYVKPLKYFLDYVDDDRHFLMDGKWHIFNQNYIQFLKRQVEERVALETPGIDYSNAGYEQWHTALSDAERSTNSYPEYYFNTLREADGYVNLDRDIATLQGQYKVEKLDLYKDDTAYFVKIGTPQKLGYVVDQAVATVKILQNRTSSIQINGTEVKPKKICLWLLLERQTEIEKISDIKSLIFLMKLAEWQKQCSNAGYDPVVRVGYRRD